MKSNDEWKQKVLDALNLAIKGGLKIPDIARQADVTAGSLYAFADKQTLGHDKLQKLAEWLRDERYLPPEFRVMEAPAEYGPSPKEWEDPVQAVALELIALGRLFQSRATTEWKVAKYEAFIRFAYANLDNFRTQLEKGREE